MGNREDHGQLIASADAVTVMREAVEVAGDNPVGVPALPAWRARPGRRAQ
jgi:hypothetical protein